MKNIENIDQVPMFPELQKATEKMSKTTGKKFASAIGTSSDYQKQQDQYTREMLKMVSFANNITRVCIQIIKSAVLQQPWHITTIDPKADKARYKNEIIQLEGILKNPNEDSPIDTWRKLTSTVIEDILTIDYGVLEKVRTPKGEVVKLYAVDGATIYPQISEEGLFMEPAYKQFIGFNSSISSKNPDAVFEKDDLMVFQENPMNGIKTGRGRSRLENVINSVVVSLQAMNFNASYFDSAKLPPALANLEDVDREDLVAFQEAFLSQLRSNDHAIAFTNAKKLQFELLRPSNQDMQFMELYEKLIQVIVSGFGLSVQDVGFLYDVNKATANVQQNLSRNRGIRSMLSIIKEEVDRDFIGDYAKYINPKFGELEMKWLELDKLEEKEQAEIHKIYVDSGVMTQNDVRHELGLDPLEEPEPVEQNIIEEDEEVIEKAVEIPEKLTANFTDRELEPDEKRVKWDEINQLITNSENKIILTIGSVVNDNIENVIQAIKEARDDSSPAKASNISLLPLTAILPEALAVSNNINTEATRLASNEIGVETEQYPITQEAIQVQVGNNTIDASEKINNEIQNIAIDAIENDFTDEQIEESVNNTSQKFINTTAALLATTLSLNTLNKSRNAVFKNNAVIKNRNNIVGLRYSAVLDRRTTEYCRSLDGTVFSITDGGIPYPPNHFHCRSILVPVRKGEAPELIDIDNVEVFNTLPDFKDQKAIKKSEILEETIVSLLKQNE